MFFGTLLWLRKQSANFFSDLLCSIFLKCFFDIIFWEVPSVFTTPFTPTRACVMMIKCVCYDGKMLSFHEQSHPDSQRYDATCSYGLRFHRALYIELMFGRFCEKCSVPFFIVVKSKRSGCSCYIYLTDLNLFFFPSIWLEYHNNIFNLSKPFSLVVVIKIRKKTNKSLTKFILLVNAK